MSSLDKLAASLCTDLGYEPSAKGPGRPVPQQKRQARPTSSERNAATAAKIAAEGITLASTKTVAKKAAKTAAKPSKARSKQPSAPEAPSIDVADTASSDVGLVETPEDKARPAQKRHTSPKVKPAKGLTGRLKWFNEKKGYGFIIPDEPIPNLKGDVFLHISEVEAAGLLEQLEDGLPLAFDLGFAKRSNSPCAQNLSVIVQ